MYKKKQKTTLNLNVCHLYCVAGEKLASNLSKFVTIVWIFVVLILTSSYTATLTSMMTVQQIKMTSFWDGLAYQIQGRPYTQLTTPEQYVKALSQSDRKPGGVLAIMSEMPYIKLFLSYYPHDYSMIKSIPSTNGFGFVSVLSYFYIIIIVIFIQTEICEESVEVSY